MHRVTPCCGESLELNNDAIYINNFVYCAKMFKKKSMRGKA